jgi:hypothetical protein
MVQNLKKKLLIKNYIVTWKCVIGFLVLNYITVNQKVDYM